MNHELESTPLFDKWLNRLKDKAVRQKLAARLERVTHGNFGDHKRISEHLFELRFTIGGGLRIYYTERNHRIILLLIGGSKKTQSKDIARAETIIKEIENENP